MKKITSLSVLRVLRYATAALLSILMLPQAWADDGHNHDEHEHPPAETGTAHPRFYAESDTFELVGVVDGHHITLYLDHYADGSPAGNTTLHLALNGIDIPVEQHAEGEFEATLEQPLAPGEITITASVISDEKSDGKAGAQTSLLTGEFDLHPAAAPDEKAASGLSYPLIGAGLLAILFLCLMWFIRRSSSTHNTRPARTSHSGEAA